MINTDEWGPEQKILVILAHPDDPRIFLRSNNQEVDQPRTSGCLLAFNMW